MSPSFFEFANPWAFALLLPALLLCLYDYKKRRTLSLPFSSKTLLTKTRMTWRRLFEFVPYVLHFIGIALLIFALARPRQGNRYEETNAQGIDIVMALDTSGSMKALDLSLQGERVDRLQVVKSVVREFIDKRVQDRIGMVVFGTQAYTQCPLTLDYDILKGYLDLIEIGLVGEETAIGDALATSVKRLEDSQAKSKIVILLTDGKNTAGQISPKQAAELAQKKGIKVYTIAVGSKGKVPYPQQTVFGIQTFYVEMDIDEKALQQIAKQTGGRYFLASNTEALKEIYATIDQLEKTEIEVKRFVDYQEQFLTYLVPALAFLFLGRFLRETVFVRLP